ncbi:MAG: cytochrome b/b6 domain-containing protein [Alphaproteobacteria bacterium]
MLARLLHFLYLGAGARAGRPRYLFYRHTLAVRVTHWMNAAVLLVMLMSGLQIFNAHPALYWGHDSDFARPALASHAVPDGAGGLRGITRIGGWTFDTTGILGASEVNGRMTARGFPSWATLPGPQWLALGRHWHFFFAWLFVINGVAFAAYAFASGHFRDLWPRWRDIRALPHEIVEHAKLRFPHGEAAKRYNALQKITYFLVIFILGPLIVLTGLTMSPTINAAFPELDWMFGGRQSARTIHFICAFAFVAFFIIHNAMVVLSGAWNNLRSMITGRYAVEKNASG